MRRFSDFLGIHGLLVEKYLRRGRIIPPAPEKNLIGKPFCYSYSMSSNVKVTIHYRLDQSQNEPNSKYRNG